MVIRRALVAAVAAVVGVLAVGGVAHADPAGPTDYRTTVVSIAPETPAVAVDIIGGDSFVQLTVTPGTEVLVTGYRGEPFLRFLADGTVEENDRSPTVYESRERYGADVPEYADAALPPDWDRVAGGGRYSWHDHRAHWMNPQPPPAAQPGERILEAVIPLQVDGAPVSVTVASDWLEEPSRVPLYAGAGAGGAAVLLALAGRRRIVWSVLAAALAAGGTGWWQFRSLPAETGPLLVWWLLPAVAAISAVVAVVLGHRLVSYALVVLAGIELAAWAYLRRDGAFRAIIPTDAPFWLDRGVLAAAALVGVVGALSGLVGLYRGPSE